MRDERNFWLYFSCRVASIVGDSLQSALLPIIVLDITISASTLGVITGFERAVTSVAMVIGGYIADRYNRKYVVISSDLLNALVIGIYLVWFRGNMMVLFGMIFLQNGIFEIFMSSSLSMFLDIVEKKDVIKKSAFMKPFTTTINLLGVPVGIFLYTKFGLEVILTINLLSFLVSGIIETLIKYQKKEVSSKGKGGIKDIKKSYKEAIEYLKVEKLHLKLIIGYLVFINALINPYLNVILPYSIKVEAGLDSMFLGYLITAMSIGTILGNIYITKNSERISIATRGWKINCTIQLVIFLFIVGIIYKGGGGPLAKTMLLFVFILNGMSNVYLCAPLFGYLGQAIESDIRGRLMSLVSLSSQISGPIMFILVGKLVESYGGIWVSLILVMSSILIQIFYFNSRFYFKDTIEYVLSKE